MITRTYEQRVRERLAQFPAVGVVGPRQCGKTTLAKQLGGTYLDMESTGAQVRLDAEWDSLIDSESLLIIDEAQHYPPVFSRLRGAIDNDRKRTGRFLLLGSVSPALVKGVSESLAGRLSSIQLTPLILPELQPKRLDDLWLFGGFPDGGILDPSMYPVWQESYLQALVGRDLPAWGLTARPQLLQRLFAMLATAHGQPLNASQLGASLGLDHKTIVKYCDTLEAAFLVHRLPPYFTNIKKRLVKTPRLYWRDSGLLHALQQVRDLEHLYHQPSLGQSWEGFVIEQTLSTIAAAGKRVQPFFFRTADGQELDLVLDWGTEIWGVEIKLTSDPSPDAIARLHQTADLIDATRRVLICRIAEPIESDRLLVTSLPDWLARCASDAATLPDMA